MRQTGIVKSREPSIPAVTAASGIVRGFAFGDEPGNGDGNTARPEGDEDGENGQGDLVKPQSFRSDEPGKDDTV